MRKLLIWILLSAGLFGLAAWANAPIDLAAAIDKQRGVAAEKPTDAGAETELANLLVLSGDLAGAERAYRKAIELDPARLTAHFNLGLLLQQRGEGRAAMKSFRRVVELDARHAWAHYQMGMIYQAWHVDDAAVRSYARAFALDPRLGQSAFNPQVIDNSLATRAMLLAFRRSGSGDGPPPRLALGEHPAPLPATPPDATPATDENAGALTPGTRLDPGAATAAEPTARTLAEGDLERGRATGQVQGGANQAGAAGYGRRPSFPGYTPPPTDAYQADDEGAYVEEDPEGQAAPQPPPGGGFGVPGYRPAPPGFRPSTPSTGRLELRLRPLDDTARG